MSIAKRRVLVVHRDAERRLALATMLSSAGYAVEAADEASIESVRGLDVVILAAPEGSDLTRGIKAGRDTARIQVIGVAPPPLNSMEPAWFAAGGDEIMEWPVKQEEFLEVLGQLLDIRDVAAHLDVGAESVAHALASLPKR